MKCPNCSQELTVKLAKAGSSEDPKIEIHSLEDVKQLFLPNAREEIKIGQANGTWWIRGPYLGREAFAQVSDAIKGLGGRWVPRGKQLAS